MADESRSDVQLSQLALVKRGPFLVEFVGAAEPLTRLSEDLDKTICVRYLDARRMRTEEGMLAEFAAALQFPWYFGGNWAAWRDCMRDPYWNRGLDCPAILIVIWSAQHLTELGPEPLNYSLRQWVTAAESLAAPRVWSDDWTDSGRACHFVLQIDQEFLPNWRSATNAIGWIIPPLTLP